jgi:N utilization substance protein B
VSDSRRAPRQRSRQAALQALYAGDLGDCFGANPRECIEEIFERVAENFDLPAGARDFALELASGTAAHLAEIDAVLSESATNWKLSRMAAVDRNVLRIAVYELTQTETPVSIILDEAIRLAQRFGTESSSAFVNGVLDAVARVITNSSTRVEDVETRQEPT